MLQFRVNGQQLERIDDSFVAQDTIQYLKATFSFSDDWDNMTLKKAIFYKADKTTAYDANIIDNVCQVPDNVANENPFYVSVTSANSTTTSGNTTITKRITTNLVKVNNPDSGWTSSLNDSSITTSTAYDNFIDAVDTKIDTLDAKYETEFNTFKSDIAFHLFEDWISTTSTDATVYNHEIRTVSSNTGAIILKPYKSADEGYVKQNLTDTWMVTDTSDRKHETEYKFGITIPSSASYSSFTFSDGTSAITPAYLTSSTIEAGKTYDVYIRDKMIVIEERDE